MSWVNSFVRERKYFARENQVSWGNTKVLQEYTKYLKEGCILWRENGKIYYFSHFYHEGLYCIFSAFKELMHLLFSALSENNKKWLLLSPLSLPRF